MIVVFIHDSRSNMSIVLSIFWFFDRSNFIRISQYVINVWFRFFFCLNFEWSRWFAAVRSIYYHLWTKKHLNENNDFWRFHHFVFKHDFVFNNQFYFVNEICIELFFSSVFSYSKNYVRYEHDRSENFCHSHDNFSFMKSHFSVDICYLKITINHSIRDVAFWQIRSTSKLFLIYSAFSLNFSHDIRFLRSIVNYNRIVFAHFVHWFRKNLIEWNHELFW